MSGDKHTVMLTKEASSSGDSSFRYAAFQNDKSVCATFGISERFAWNNKYL